MPRRRMKLGRSWNRGSFIETGLGLRIRGLIIGEFTRKRQPERHSHHARSRALPAYNECKSVKGSYFYAQDKNYLHHRPGQLLL